MPKIYIPPPAPRPTSASEFPAPEDWKKLGYFSVVFYLLLDSMASRQKTVMTEASEIENNAKFQDKLNQLNGAIKFSILPPNAKISTINEVQTKNQQYAALRENIQNMLITSRQENQENMTFTSTDVDRLQQDGAEDSGWLQMLNAIFQVVNSISGR